VQIERTTVVVLGLAVVFSEVGIDITHVDPQRRFAPLGE
jgi:hypothetical protein